MKGKLVLFLKGMLMGVCDLIPGISGGTIAFITGIYERLISAIKGFSPKLIFNFKGEFKKLDLGFLIILFAGIIVSILLGSRIIDNLLENHYAKTISFFVGLILASSLIIFQNIREHKTSEHIFGIIGLVVGVGLIFLNPAEANISFGYLFLGGFIAISAMFLPGISGSFILLVMGLYESIIDMLGNVMANLSYLVVFILGMIVGAFVISRLISYLFSVDKNKTLYFLLGLVIGSLGVPVMKIYEVGVLDPLLLIMGAVLVLVVGRYSGN